ncbi:hypothetical protein G7K_1772-t1 [Saitoella complicata NRRL Y-17804]|uniref:Uncharacterized protein n=1 Tax=Saitoella complicata (strain BCRC 22490 / CBS 7301 / JCM 7358 / NBRC 10748 / NRRL Y-17804) TaxID=698492 RepID=A0A0E9NCK4_SAICN|nr:hypothetical protein G7K_1772-t1 [Saitoella complicata NRRL Y-17804]
MDWTTYHLPIPPTTPNSLPIPLQRTIDPMVFSFMRTRCYLLMFRLYFLCTLSQHFPLPGEFAMDSGAPKMRSYRHAAQSVLTTLQEQRTMVVDVSCRRVVSMSLWVVALRGYDIVRLRVGLW